MNVKLLRKVAKHILEEPKRFLMGNWIILQDEEPGGSYLDDREEATEFAKCGTAACIAGWTCILGGRAKTEYAWRDAGELLGINTPQRDSLFYEDEWPDEFRRKYREAESHQERALVAVQMIEHFIKTGE